jgi:hypothetical protein
MLNTDLLSPWVRRFLLESRIIHAPLLARLKISGNLTVCGCQL